MGVRDKKKKKIKNIWAKTFWKNKKKLSAEIWKSQNKKNSEIKTKGSKLKFNLIIKYHREK